MKNFMIFLFTLLLFSIAVFGQNKFDELNNLAEKAIELNPNIKMLRAKLEAVKTKPAQNTNLPDPTLSVGLMNMPTNSFSFSQEAMTGKMVSLSQAFPFPGKLSAASDVLEKDIESAQQEIQEEKNKLRLKITEAYFDLALVREKIIVANETKRLFNSINEVVKTKYEVNEASQQNLFSIELELTDLDNQLSELYASEKIAQATLNSLLYRNSSEDIATIPLDTLYSYNIPGIDSLINIAKTDRPQLTQFQIMENKAAMMKELADYDSYPDFNLTLQYTQRDKLDGSNMDLHDFFSVIVGVKLPINYGGKNSAKTSEAVSLADMYEQQYQNALQMLRISFESSTAKLNSLIEREDLTNNVLLMQAQENFNSALASYQVNRVDFVNVTNALTKLLNLETQLYKIRTDYYKEIASMEYLSGTELFQNLK